MSEQNSEKISFDKQKFTYVISAVIVGFIILFFLNRRGGLFLVTACNQSTDNCYTVEANLDREDLSNKNAKLFFNNGGSLDIYCEQDFGCSSEDGENWSIHKIKRLGDAK